MLTIDDIVPGGMYVCDPKGDVPVDSKDNVFACWAKWKHDDEYTKVMWSYNGTFNTRPYLYSREHGKALHLIRVR